ncbi:hypothetical protein BLOT_014950 [Blomia tropicalis]|nr:hypothetical protein BLOT_014950 [Blomia tropicalis]
MKPLDMKNWSQSLTVDPSIWGGSTNSALDDELNLSTIQHTQYDLEDLFLRLPPYLHLHH